MINYGLPLKFIARLDDSTEAVHHCRPHCGPHYETLRLAWVGELVGQTIRHYEESQGKREVRLSLAQRPKKFGVYPHS
jgi:hypothetical protein